MMTPSSPQSAAPTTPPTGTGSLPARQVVENVSRRLAAAGVPSPPADARWLVEAFCGVDAGRRPDAPILADVAANSRLQSAIERRCKREPLQLIIGRTAFLDFEVACRPGVFIPRPETEVLANLAIAAARDNLQPRVIELCTGSGVVAGAIARHVHSVELVAVDLDEHAVAASRSNVAAIAPGSRHVVVQGDLFDALAGTSAAAWRGSVDVVVANPPYLPAAEVTDWEPEVADYDPRRALVGGPDGHEFVERILSAGREWLRPGGVVLLEIDARRSAEAIATAQRLGWFDAEAVADLAGFPRFLRAWNGLARRRERSMS